MVGPADGPTWDSTQLRLDLQYGDGREAAFDIHTSLGHARQFSRLRRAGGAVPLRQRRVERPQPQARRRMHDRRQHAAGTQDHDQQPLQRHVSRALGRAQRSAATASRCSSGSSAELATVEFGGPAAIATEPAGSGRPLAYNDLAADRQTVAAVQAMEAILARHAAGKPNCVVRSQRARRAGWCCARPARASPKSCTRRA